ncbi:MAG: FkbM family methyltransferase [Thermoplasmata archaeon]|nr:FkbM family methyltransferase [Thermoplasmata archaeon]
MVTSSGEVSEPVAEPSPTTGSPIGFREGPLSESHSIVAAVGWWVRQLLGVRPASVRDAGSLYLAVGRAGFAFWRDRSAPVSFGQYLARDIVVRPFGLRISVHARSDDLFYAMEGHKPALLRWFQPRAGEFVVDVGAHLGLYALMAARRGARVLAIEPNPRTFRELADHVRTHHANVEALEVALGREPGMASLYSAAAFSGVSSLLPGWADQYRSDAVGEVTVQVVRLDALLRTRNVTQVDWLLVDAEGSEAEILDGAGDLLNSTRTVIIEVAHGAVAERCEQILLAHGFRIAGVSRQNDVNSYWLAVR